MNTVLIFLTFVTVGLWMVVIQGASSLKKKLEKLGEELFGPQGGWRVRMYPKLYVLQGVVRDHVVRYSVWADEGRRMPSKSFMLVEYPVRQDVHVRANSRTAVSRLEASFQQRLRDLQAAPGFEQLEVSARELSWLGRLGSWRPLGFGRRPGLLLYRIRSSPFDAAAIRQDIDMLLDLAESGL